MPTYGAEWKLSTTAGLWATWLLLADTDRFNRARNAGLAFRALEDADGLPRYRGTSTAWGGRTEWVETPFDFEAPRWYRIERRPVKGSVSRWSLHMQLTGRRGGTDISYVLEVDVDGMFARRRVYAQVEGVVKPGIAQALADAVALLEGKPSTYDPPPPELGAAEKRSLHEVAYWIDPEVAGPLVHHITTAPLHQQVRMSPLRMATQWGLADQVVIEAFVEATRRGALALEWTEMRGGVPRVFDKWDGMRPASVFAQFRTHPRIRDFDVPTLCPFSPAATPHVLARQQVRRRETLEWQLTLAPDLYEIEAPGVPRASLQVRPGLRTGAATVDVTDDGVFPAVLRVAPGDAEIRARSTLDRDTSMSLVTRTRGRRHLSAGRLLQYGAPRDAMGAEFQLRAERAMVLAVQPLDAPKRALRQIAKVVRSCRAATVEQVDDAVIATWPEPAWMLSAAEALGCDPRVGMAVGVGNALFVGRGGVPAGEVVESTILAARRAGGARTVLPTASAADAELEAALAHFGQRVKVVPHNSFFQILEFVRAQEARTRGTGTATLRRRKTGKVLGRRYRLGEVLGRGGMGQVHEARDLNTGQEIAVKLLLPEYASDPVHAQRFFNEARITSSLKHDNTLRVLDWGQAGSGELYLAMERLEGFELKDLLEERSLLDPRSACSIAIDVLGSLAEAHRAGIVHRDIKPANIFLCANDHVKVIDFGIAWSNEDVEEIQLDPELVLGTPRYMSPEQLEGEALDGRSDLYSLALTLYECVAGTLPFECQDQLVMAYRRLTKPVTPLDELARQPVPSRLGRVLDRALQREPEHRHPDCGAMQAELREVLAT